MSTPAFDAGCVSVHLDIVAARVVAVDIACRRPDVAALLRGKGADVAKQLTPLLYSLCAVAQGRAAQLALAAAAGATAPPTVDAAVAAEAMREHLWRCLLDLPPLLGQAPRRDLFLAAAAAVAAGERKRLAQLLANDDWRRLIDALSALKQPPAADDGVALLPSLTAAASLSSWPRLDVAFAAQPQWCGGAAETGAWARAATMAPPPLQSRAAPWSARWLARMGELQRWAGADSDRGSTDDACSLDDVDGSLDQAEGLLASVCGAVSATPVAPNVGRSLVMTARGLLMHEVAVVDGVINDYVIVAPTQWNFHRHGRLAAWLRGAAASSQDLPAQLAHAVAALDPCVRCEAAATHDGGALTPLPRFGAAALQTS